MNCPHCTGDHTLSQCPTWREHIESDELRVAARAFLTYIEAHDFGGIPEGLEADRLRAAIAAPSPAHDRASCCLHDSDCAVHNAPALPVGPCDCTLAPAPAQQASSDLPEGWRDVLEKVRDGICAGGLAEYATHERSIVGPYLDAVYDELAALEEEAAAQEQAKPTLDIEQVFALSRQVKPTDLQAVPDGWKLVPVAATEEMHAAAVKTIIRCLGNDDFPPKVYAAMLAAAPTPPAAPPSPQPVADAAALASWLERFDKQMEGAGYARETRKHIAALMMRMSEKFKYGTPARPTASQASYLSPIKLTASENSPGLWMDEQGTYYEPADALQPVADAWISVDERLPDECKYVAVLYWPYNNRENRQIVGYAEYVEGEFYTHEGDEHHPPSHWCALPDFPIHGALSGNTAAKGE